MLSAIAASVFATPAAALEFGETRGGWTIVNAEDACLMDMDYEGPGETNVKIFKDVDGRIVASVVNSNWSAKPNASYKVDFAVDGNVYSGGDATGVELGGKRGFVVGMGDGFERDLAAGSALRLYIDGNLIDDLSLAGTTVALAAVNRCLTQLRRESAAIAREKARWSDLPTDPFSGPDAPAATGLASKPAPRGNIGTWASSVDYPSAALRTEAKGVTAFRLTVGSDGRATACEVTGPSGSAELDATTCTLMMRRSRFTPAKADDGTPVVGTWESSVRWDIPASPPPAPMPVTCVAGEICRQDQG